MNKIKKALFLVLSVLLLVGCFGNMTPSEKVENMLNKYIKNDKDILDELEMYMAEQDLSKVQREKYMNVIIDEYSSIKYKIKNETIDGDEAVVEVDIEVIDLYRASREAGDYLVENAEEFYVDDIYDESKFIDYKLDVLENAEDTIKYTIYINLTRIDGVWTINDLDEDTLEKIHGIYDYETNS